MGLGRRRVPRGSIQGKNSEDQHCAGIIRSKPDPHEAQARALGFVEGLPCVGGPRELPRYPKPKLPNRVGVSILGGP